MRGVIVLSVVWFLTACAGQSQQSTRLVVDWEKVERVEAAHAGRAGPSDVIWLHYPRKRVPVESGENDS